MKIRIAMVAGETSGDLLASHLMRALREQHPEIEFFGIGGPRMQAEGMDILWPSERLAVHGYVEALKRYRELSGIRRKLLARVLQEKPDAFIGIDAPDFNLWLERKIRVSGIPAVHYVSPSIWAWRGSRIHRIARSVSHMLCLFPFEPALYEAAGVPVSYVGHPLADVFPLQPDRAAARVRLGLEVERTAPLVALLPGSRQSEVQNLANLLLATARELHTRHPGCTFLVPLATQETRELFLAAVRLNKVEDLPLRLVFGHSVDVMTAADVVVLASGTATLEAALLKRPMVITYRVGKWSYRLMKHMLYLPWVGLPNILCRESIVPELLQDAATPQALADAVDGWLGDAPRCAALTERFTALHHELRQDSAHRAAAAVLACIAKDASWMPQKLAHP